jgi:hypothetical protein
MIGRVVGRLLLTVFYFLIVTPAALVRRLVSGNPLEHPATDKGYWQPHVAARPGAEDMRRPS